MMNAVVLALLLIFQGAPPATHGDDLARMSLSRVTSAMAYPGADATSLEWVYCGEPNAFYVSSQNRVYVCHELVEFLKEMAPNDWSGAVRAVVAHEYAHAVIGRQDIPFTGSEETAADELATLAMVSAGMGDDMITLARVWAARWMINPVISMELTEEHAPGVVRARSIMCLILGQSWDEPNCHPIWARTQAHWARLLKVWPQ